MLESSNPNIDIDALIARIKDLVAKKRTIVKAAGAPEEKLAELTPGSVIHFGENGNSSAYVRSGWSHAEPEHQWTSGTESELVFSLPATQADLILSFRADPLTGGKVTTHLVQAEWNGTLVGEWSIKQGGIYSTFVWSRHHGASRRTTLRFVIPTAFSPASANLNSDARVLGLCFKELRLFPVSDLGI